MEITISANVVAWYAAIVSTGAAAISGYVAWRDRTALRVQAQADMKVAGVPHLEGQTIILIQVRNVGRRTVTLSELPYFQVPGETSAYMVKGSWEPNAELTEGKSATMICIQQKIEAELPRITRVIVRDEAGREWRGKLVRNNRI